MCLGVQEKKRREKRICTSFSPGNPVLGLRFPSTPSPDYLDERHDGFHGLYAILTCGGCICIYVLLIETAGFKCLALEMCSFVTSSFLFSCKRAVMLPVHKQGHYDLLPLLRPMTHRVLVLVLCFACQKDWGCMTFVCCLALSSKTWSCGQRTMKASHVRSFDLVDVLFAELC